MAAHAANSGQPHQFGYPDFGAQWSLWYTDYLTRSTTQSAKTLELFQEIMHRVARGQISPTALQDMLPVFAQRRGTEYATGFAKLSSHFFSGMVRLGTAYSREQAELLMPGSRADDFAPPEFDTADPVRFFQQVTQYTTELNARIAKAYQSHMERSAAGGTTLGQLQQATTDYYANRLPEHLREIGRLYFEFLNDLGELRTAYERDYLAIVLASANETAGEGAFVVNLTAPVGETATAALSLSNTRNDRAVIRCVATDVRRADGVGRAFSPQVTFTPEALELDPGEEGKIRLSLLLNPDDYDGNAPYVGAVYITGHEEPRVEVPLRILAVSAPAP